MKHLFTLFIALLAAAGSFAQSGNCGAEGSNLTWSLNSSTGVLTISGNGAMANYSYTTLEGGGYMTTAPWSEHASLLKSLVFEEGITRIGEYAFIGCIGFTGSLTIPNSVKTIERAAFYNCIGFAGSLTLGSSVETIGINAFFSAGFTGSLTIPNSVETIENSAFRNCTGFNGNLTIGNSVETIGESAFQACTGFNGSLTIGNSVKTIGVGAFSNCTGFTGSLNISNSVETIGESAFYSCSGFTGSLIIPNSVKTIEAEAFQNCTGFNGSLTIGNLVETIGEYAFQNCTDFTGSLTIGNSVKTIGVGAFSTCTGFTGDLTIPNSVETIGNEAFSSCTGFTGSLTIGNSVETIGNWAFAMCRGFTSIESKAATPPVAEALAFANVPTIPLYVPIGTVEAYEAAPVWSDFDNIAESGNPIIFTVSFNSNGGTAVAPITTEYGTIAAPTPPTKDGSTFEGWFLDAGLVYEWDFDSDIVQSNITLHAKWIVVSSISKTEANAIKVYATPQGIAVANATAGETITVYSLSGMQIATAQTEGSETNVAVQARGVYLVRVGNFATKVIF